MSKIIGKKGNRPTLYVTNSKNESQVTPNFEVKVEVKLNRFC